MNLILLAALLVLWVASLSSWKLRNLRTVTILVVLSSVLLLLGGLPQPASSLAQGLTWLVSVLAIGLRGDPWLVVDGSEVRFAESYAGELQRIAELKTTVRTAEPSAYIAAFDRIVGAFAGLSAPSADWAALRDDTVRELSIRSTVMKVGVDPPPEALTEAASRWAAIEARFDLLMRSLRRSWLIPDFARRSPGRPKG